MLLTSCLYFCCLECDLCHRRSVFEARPKLVINHHKRVPVARQWRMCSCKRGACMYFWAGPSHPKPYVSVLIKNRLIGKFGKEKVHIHGHLFPGPDVHIDLSYTYVSSSSEDKPTCSLLHIPAVSLPCHHTIRLLFLWHPPALSCVLSPISPPAQSVFSQVEPRHLASFVNFPFTAL